MWVVNDLYFTLSCFSGKQPFVCGGNCHTLAVLIMEPECTVRQGLDSGGNNSQHFSVL